jgi:hypothetical protein
LDVVNTLVDELKIKQGELTQGSINMANDWDARHGRMEGDAIQKAMELYSKFIAKVPVLLERFSEALASLPPSP